MPKVKKSLASASTSSPDTEKIPRPRNAFIIFRTDLSAARASQGNPTQGSVSKEASELWAKASAVVKKEYHLRAEQEKQEHALKYPGYVYKPRTQAQIAKDKVEQARLSGRKMKTRARTRTRSSNKRFEQVIDLELDDFSAEERCQSPGSTSSPSIMGADSDNLGYSPICSNDSHWDLSKDSGSRKISPYLNISIMPFMGENTWNSDYDSSHVIPTSYTSYTSPPYEESFRKSDPSMYDATHQAEFLRAFDALGYDQNFDSAEAAFKAGPSDASLATVYLTNGGNSLHNLPLANNMEPSVPTSSGSNDFVLDPSLLPRSYFEEELYQPQQPIDRQLEYFRIPSYNMNN